MKYAKKSNQKPLIVALSVTAVLLLIAISILLFLDSKDTIPDNPAAPTDGVDTMQTQPAETDATSGQAETTVPAETATAEDASDPDMEATDATENPAPPKNPANPENTENPEKPTSPSAPEDLAIDTPYATLYFPVEWKSYLVVDVSEEDIYAVKFVAKLNSGKSQDLFTIGFGGAAETAVGALKASNGTYINVQMEVFDFTPDTTWSEEEKTIVYNMREALNNVISGLQLEEITQVQDTTSPVDDVEAVQIDTPFVKLYYPSRWEDTLRLDIKEDSVGFYCAVPGREEKLLFTVFFGGSRGTAVTVVQNSAGNSTEVRIEAQEIDLDDSWTQDQREIVYAMQEDINFLLERLP